MGGEVGQKPLAHRGQHQGHRQHQQQRDGVEQQPQIVGKEPHAPLKAVGPADPPHEAVGGPDGKVNGKYQGEPEHGGAGSLPHILQIGAAQLHRRPGHHRVQHAQDAGHIQLQEAQEGADKDEDGEQGKEDIVGEGRALPGDIVAVIARDQLMGKGDGRPAAQLVPQRKFSQSAPPRFCWTAVLSYSIILHSVMS